MKSGFLNRILEYVRGARAGAVRPGNEFLRTLRAAIDAGDLKRALDIESSLTGAQALSAEVLVLRARLALASGDAIRATAHLEEAIGKAPLSGEAHFWCASAYMQRGMESEALEHALAVERIKPGHPDMRTLIGVVRHHQNDVAGAKAAFESALEVDSSNMDAHRSLAVIYFQEHEWPDAERHFRRLAEAQPESSFALSGHASCLVALGREAEAWPLFSRALDLPVKSREVHADYAVALFDDGQLEKARSQIDAALHLDPNQALLHVGRANCELIANGSSAAGWAEYEWRLKLDANRYGRRTRMWTGEEGHTGRLLVYAEQGMGDVILFSRYLDQLGKRVGGITLQIPPVLGRLMRASAARFGWNIAEWKESASRVEPGETPYDHEVPLLSLMHACGFPVERNTHPYLDVDAELTRHWARKLGPRSPDRLRIGLVWAGNPRRREDVIRSILPEQLAPLQTLKNADFVSLQMDCRPVYKKTPLPVAAVDPTSEIRDFADTAAIMHNLDLVLSIDTAAAHLAGALGIPCWVLLSRVPDWRWRMGGIEQPWYGALRSFTVERQRDWVPLMEQVAEQLRHESHDTLGKYRYAGG